MTMFLVAKSNGLKPKAIGFVAGLVIGATSLYAPLASAAPIYKVVDEQTGKVTFTDNPQSYEQQAGTEISQTSITTGNSTAQNSNNRTNTSMKNNQPASPLSANQSSPPPMDDNSAMVQATRISYQLTMTEPSEERSYQRPAQNIVVNVQTKPALQADDYVVIAIDGKEVARGLSATVATVDMLPGQHNVEVTIKNKAGQTLQQVSRNVYLIQNTMAIRDRKKMAQQLLAYQNLPWHQKMLLKLRQKEAAKP